MSFGRVPDPAAYERANFRAMFLLPLSQGVPPARAPASAPRKV
jgi:hypothetical protein